MNRTARYAAFHGCARHRNGSDAGGWFAVSAVPQSGAVGLLVAAAPVVATVLLVAAGLVAWSVFVKALLAVDQLRVVAHAVAWVVV